MLAEITSMQLMCWRLSRLADAGRMTAAMASLAKMNHAAKARAIVADARDILGGDGILLDNHVARHHADMEAIFTFEGTDSVQALIVGRHITGLSAISGRDRKSTRLNSSHGYISYAVFCLKKKTKNEQQHAQYHDLALKQPAPPPYSILAIVAREPVLARADDHPDAHNTANL